MTGNLYRGTSRKQVMRRLMCIFLVAVMALGVLPPVSVSAAGGSITIDNIYTAPQVTDDSLVTRVSTSPITLHATINGISADQAPNLYYEITNMNTGAIRTNTSARPTVSENGFNVTFTDVELTEGLNKIVIKLDGINVISSVPGWVYFTPTVRIDELQIDGARWEEDKIYPEEPEASTIIEIGGKVYNANVVNVQKYGDPAPQTFSSIGNEFSIFADQEDGWRNADFFLEPGDNILTFNASNSTYSYQIERNLIYDNGQPFAYEAVIRGTGDKLLKNPTITTGGAVTIDAKVKVDLESPGVLEYPDLEVRVNSNTHAFDLAAMTPSSRTDRYEIYDVTLTENVTAADIYTVDFVFSNGINNVRQSNLSFTYIDPNQPFINHVARKIGDTDTVGTMISDTSQTEINEQPATFYIYANERTTGVSVYLNQVQTANRLYTSTSYQAVTIDGNNYRRFEYTMEGVLSGTHQLIVVPSDGTGAYDFGKKTYNILVSSAPSVILYNAYSGMVIESLSDLRIGTGSTYGVTGRLINVPDLGRITGNDPNKMSDMVVFMNNVDISDFLTVDAANSTFRVLFSADMDAPNSLRQGTNILKFDIYLRQGGSLQRITSAEYEIFLFSDNAPAIVDIRIDEDENNPVFTPGNLPNTYFTNEEEVRFYGTLANVDEITLTVYRRDADGTPIPDEFDHLYDPDGDGNFERNPNEDTTSFFSTVQDDEFATRWIDLSPRGESIFEFVVTNRETQIEVIRTITITREPVPFVIEYPRTFTNERGLPQANVNSNYVEVEVRAEYADDVIYDGKPARKASDHRFYFEVEGLRSGRSQNINFTVVRGQEETNGTLVINYADQPVTGAKFKTGLSNRIRVFDNMIDLRFPRGSSFKRYGTDDTNPYLSTERKMVFGIADSQTGVVDYDLENPTRNGEIHVGNREGNFFSVSPLFWIDAGTIDRNERDLAEAYTGSGRLPYNGVYFYNRDQEDLVVPTERVELTLKYDDSIVNEAWRYLTVFQYDVYEDLNGDIRGGWRNIGGVVNTRNKTITVQVDRFGYFQVMYMAQSFTDVVSHDWAKNDIETLYSKGIMGPRPNSTLFRPSEAISRGEFITMLVKIFDLPLNYEGDATFVDARNNRNSDGLWDYKYIETAARAGIVRGVGNLGQFSPNQTLTREQASVMIARAANLKLDTNDTKVLQNLQKSFTDANAINLYARSSVDAIVKQGIITGKQHAAVGDANPTYYFDPNATFTRAEAAAVAIRVLQNQKKIPR